MHDGKWTDELGCYGVSISLFRTKDHSPNRGFMDRRENARRKEGGKWEMTGRELTYILDTVVTD